VGSYLYNPPQATPPQAALIILHGHGGCATQRRPGAPAGHPLVSPVRIGI
jgi:hypothetical protein